MSMRLATTSMMLSFFFTAMDLKGLLQCGRQRDDARALARGIAAVEHLHRNVLFDGGQDGGRMQHLGAEVGQFGGLFKADDLHAQRIGADARIGGHDAVDVGPDFDGVGGERAADEGAGEVGAAAAQGGGDAGFVRSDEAAHHRHLGLVDERAQLLVGALFDDGVVRDGLLELRVGDDDVARVDVGGVDVALAERGGDDAAGDALAVADDQVGDARGELENGGQAAQDFVERIEFLVDEVAEGGRVFRFLTRAQAVSRWRERRRELMASAPVRSPTAAAAAARSNWSVTLAMALTTTTGLLALRDAAGNDGRGTADGGRIFDRRAAKLHDYQAHAKLQISWARQLATASHGFARCGFGHRLQLAQAGQQLGVQDGGAGGSANGVVREHGELPVEHVAGAQAADRDGHAVAAIAVEARLRTVRLRGPLDGLIGRGGQVLARPAV